MNCERSERGAVLVLVALSMIVLLGFAALVIDLAYLYLTKNQLHVAADGSSLAGATQIVSTTDCASVVGSPNYGARTQAQTFAAFHKAGSATGQTPVNLALNETNAYVADGVIDASDGDIVLGNFTRGRTPQFIRCGDPDGTPVNAVRVHARRNSDSGAGSIDLSNAPVSTVFASVLDPVFSTSNVASFATAEKTSRSSLPIALPRCVVPAACVTPSCSSCGSSSSDPLTITYIANTSDNGAWTTFLPTFPQSGACSSGGGGDLVKCYVENPLSIPCISPENPSGPIIAINGQISSALHKLVEQCIAHGGTTTDPDKNCSISPPWSVQLPVIDIEEPSCPIGTTYSFTPSNSGDQPIIGFTTFGITEVVANEPGGDTHITGTFSECTGVIGEAQCSALVE